MPATKKVGGKRKAKSPKARNARKLMSLLRPGEDSIGPAEVIVQKGKPKDLYDVWVKRELQDIAWWTPDGTDLWIEFISPPSARRMNAVRPKRTHTRLPRKEHAKVPTPPNAKGVAVEYHIHVTWDGVLQVIDPFIIIQP